MEKNTKGEKIPLAPLSNEHAFIITQCCGASVGLTANTGLTLSWMQTVFSVISKLGIMWAATLLLAPLNVHMNAPEWQLRETLPADLQTLTQQVAIMEKSSPNRWHHAYWVFCRIPNVHLCNYIKYHYYYYKYNRMNRSMCESKSRVRKRYTVCEAGQWLEMKTGSQGSVKDVSRSGNSLLTD